MQQTCHPRAATITPKYFVTATKNATGIFSSLFCTQPEPTYIHKKNYLGLGEERVGVPVFCNPI